jgi:hypothetical protein
VCSGVEMRVLLKLVGAVYDQCRGIEERIILGEA